MKIELLAILILAAIVGTSCTENRVTESTLNDSRSDVFQSANGGVVSSGNTIVYNVYLKPQDMTDPYAPELYENFNREAFVDSLFEAIYHNRAQVTDMSGNPLTIDSIKTLEIEDPRYFRDKLAGVQFTEEWTFCPKTKTMTKKVRKMLVGYELVEDSMIVALRPGFVFTFD